MTTFLEKLQSQREIRRKELEQSLQEITQKLKDIGALKIIVFGSFISGIRRRWSDLDMIVIMPSTRSGKEWFKEIYDKVETGVSADILPFTTEEFNKKIEASSFLRHALKTGKVVYEKG